MSEKPKHEKAKSAANPRMNHRLFLALWTAGHVASWLSAALINKILSSMRIYIVNDLLFAFLLALGTGIPVAIVQTLLVERGLKRSMKGWLPVSVLGWSLSAVAFFVVWESRLGLYGIPRTRWMYLALFVPVALIQVLWLRDKVKSAGLWVLSAIVGALLFVVPTGISLGGTYWDFRLQEYLLMGVCALLYSVGTGATMAYLMTQANDEKIKNAALSEGESVQLSEPLERLQDKTGDDELHQEHHRTIFQQSKADV